MGSGVPGSNTIRKKSGKPKKASPIRPTGLRLGTPALTTRGLGGEDIQEVVELEADTLSAWNREHLEDELQQSAGFQFLVRNKTKKRILAVLLGRIAADEAEILKLSVAEFIRNMGVGYHLLGFAVKYCSKRGVKNCFLELRASNEIARRLYEKLGFVTAETRKDYYDGPVEDAILMQFEL